jgi:DNA-binding MarR family transcriptional regulator
MLSSDEKRTWLLMIRTMNRINRQLAADMRHENDHRINEYDVLVNLLYASQPDKGLRMQDLADRVIISNSGMTRLVDRLVKKGYVARRTGDENRREVYVTLTDSGRTLAQSLTEAHQARVQSYVMQHITPDERHTLQAVFRRIAEANEVFLPELPDSD